MKRQNGGKQMQSLWQIMPPGKREKRHGKHPTQKPEALLTRIIESPSSNFFIESKASCICDALITSKKYIRFIFEIA